MKRAKESLQTAEKTLYTTMDRNTNAGLKAVARIARDHNIAGVYGPLYSLFTVLPVYRQAAEVTAGTRFATAFADVVTS